jgi:hypothetical protein
VFGELVHRDVPQTFGIDEGAVHVETHGVRNTIRKIAGHGLLSTGAR